MRKKIQYIISKDLPYDVSHQMGKSNFGGKRVRQKFRIFIPGLFMPIHFIFQFSVNTKQEIK